MPDGAATTVCSTEISDGSFGDALVIQNCVLPRRTVCVHSNLASLGEIDNVIEPVDGESAAQFTARRVDQFGPRCLVPARPRHRLRVATVPPSGRSGTRRCRVGGRQGDADTVDLIVAVGEEDETTTIVNG